MSQIYKNQGGGGGGGAVFKIQPDHGANVTPVGGTIIATGGGGSPNYASPFDINLETFNNGTNVLQVAMRFRGQVTTSDGAGQTQTILSIPVTVASNMVVEAFITGIEASIPSGVGGTITGSVFRGAGAATLIGTGNKFLTTSDPLIGASDITITASGNNLIVTVTGTATYTIEWYCVAIMVEKTFI